MNKPIEVGCLVVIVKGNAAGASGRVARWINKGDQYMGFETSGMGWLVTNGDSMGTFSPDYIRRIDDYTEETETQEEEMVV